jgi:hypothetical protein
MYDDYQEDDMKNRLSFIVVIIPFCVLACSTGEKGDLSSGAELTPGVQWVGLSLDDAKIQAANENKLIMVDVFSPT